MSYKQTIQSILVISIAGMLFSGYLSYYELFVPEGCEDAIVSCGEKNVTIATLPACVYGFIMYSIVFALTAFSLYKNKSKNAEKK